MSDYQVWRCLSCGYQLEVLFAHGKPSICPCCSKTEFRTVGVVKK